MSTSLIYKRATVCRNKDGQLQLRVERDSGCGHCSGSPVCGFSALPGTGAMHMLPAMPGRGSCEVGQVVRLTLPAAGVGRLALLYYLTIPVLMFSGAFVFSCLYSSGGDLGAILGSALGFLVGCVVLKLYDAHAGQYWLSRLDMQQLPE